MIRRLRPWLPQWYHREQRVPRRVSPTARMSQLIVEALEERTLLATSLLLSGFPSATTAGVLGSLTVSAKNSDGSMDTAYGGTITFASTDGQAALPSSYTFVAADQGVHTFPVMLKTAGTQAVTATDTVISSITGSEGGISVAANAASSLVLSGYPTPVTSGEASSMTVTAKDAYGNTVTNYLGLVHFSSSDSQALLPVDYTFGAGDLGVHLFSATLKTTGSQSLTATDVLTPSITGSESGILVRPAWAHPELLTVSFVPDGTVLSTGSGGTATSSLFAYMNAKYPAVQWQAAILSAVQTWAQQANLNFDVVADNGTTSGQGNYQQGDPGMGDLRIGAYNFGNSYLAGAYLAPPTNNYSIAGDFNFNTGKSLNIGTTYDIQTVALHELGHSLGLGHTTVTTAVMYPSYHGVNRSLSSTDISNIQALYGPRQPDAYNAANTSFAAAAALNGLISNQTAVVNNLSINSTTQAEYFVVTAPANSGSTLTVTAQSAGLSMFTPSVTVYAADQSTVLGSASSTVQYHGVTVSTTLSGVVPGQPYYIKVTGVDSSAFSTGAFALTLNFGTGPTPSVTLPATKVLDGAVLQGGGGLGLDGLLGTGTRTLTSLFSIVTSLSVPPPAVDFMASSPDQIPPCCLMQMGGCTCPACRAAASAAAAPFSQVLQAPASSTELGVLAPGSTPAAAPLATAEGALLTAWTAQETPPAASANAGADAYFAGFEESREGFFDWDFDR